jgi:hypothetical protein
MDVLAIDLPIVFFLEIPVMFWRGNQPTHQYVAFQFAAFVSKPDLYYQLLKTLSTGLLTRCLQPLDH